MRKHFSKIIIALIAILAIMTSCRSAKDFIYMKDVVPGDHYTFYHHQPVVHAGDKLKIIVSCKNPELAIPFNSNGGVIQVSSNTGNMLENTAEVQSTSYRVDYDGNIEFPILGTLHVNGLTAKEVQNMIKEKIIEGKYITNPLVTMEFLNFKYSVLGAVNRNGSFSSENGRVTLLEAIAAAGDLKTNANLKRVLVYREENGYEVMYEHDITNSEFLNSPCYFLQQNDLIYVEPKEAEKNVSEKSWRFASILVSTLSTVVYTVYMLMLVKNQKD